jgi:hypothetical protein
MTVHRGPRHAPDPLCFGGGAGTLADLRGFLAFEAADLPTGKPAVRGHALAQPLAPGVETTVPLYLRCPRGPGDRVVAVAVGCRGRLKWCLLCTWLSIGWGLGRQVRYQLQAAAEQAADESTVTVEERVHVAKPFVLASTLTPQTVWPARAHRVRETRVHTMHTERGVHRMQGLVRADTVVAGIGVWGWWRPGTRRCYRRTCRRGKTGLCAQAWPSSRWRCG